MRTAQWFASRVSDGLCVQTHSARRNSWDYGPKAMKSCGARFRVVQKRERIPMVKV